LRIIKNNKGQARIIEAFLATLLLIGCIAIIPTYSTKTQPYDFSSFAIETLTSLDNNGKLAVLIDSRDWVTLRSCIDLALPLTLWYNLTVFDENMKPVNPFPLCSSGTVSDNIDSSDYVSVSPSSTYRVYLIRLQLSQVGSQ
jgi:hypothetical protein